jgi:hypothetical protein
MIFLLGGPFKRTTSCYGKKPVISYGFLFAKCLVHALFRTMNNHKNEIIGVELLKSARVKLRQIDQTLLCCLDIWLF